MHYVKLTIIFALGCLAGYGTAWQDALDLIERHPIALRSALPPAFLDCMRQREILIETTNSFKEKI